MSTPHQSPASTRTIDPPRASGIFDAKSLFAPIDIPMPNDRDFEIEFWSGVTATDPNHFEALSFLSILYTARGDHESGLQTDLRLVSIQPRNPTCRYNLACSHSLLGRIDEAFDALREAIRLGFSDLDHIENDADLHRLRRDPRYRAVASRLIRASGMGVRRSTQKLP